MSTVPSLVTKFYRTANLKLWVRKRSEKHYDFFNDDIEIISAEKDSSLLDLLEDELILGITG